MSEDGEPAVPPGIRMHLEQSRQRLENIADELYRAPAAAGATVDLTTLIEATTGAPFTGIDGTGTWILALNCGECSNPAPWFLTILEPCP